MTSESQQYLGRASPVTVRCALGDVVAGWIASGRVIPRAEYRSVHSRHCPQGYYTECQLVSHLVAEALFRDAYE